MKYTIALVYERKSEYLTRGFSKDECAELEDNETIDALTSTLHSLGHIVVQVGHIKNLVACLAKGSHEAWDLVFSTSEGIHGLAREAQVPALLEAYEIPFVGPDAASTMLCHDKSKAKLSLEHFAIPTAPWCLVSNDRDSRASSMPDRVASAKDSSRHAHALKIYPLFAKPVAEGSSKGIYPCSKVECQSELEQTVSLLCAQYPDQDILVESYLAGREFTVGILGTASRARVIGAFEIRIHGPWEKAEAAQRTKEVEFLTSDLKDTWEGVDGVDGVSYEECMPDMESDSEAQEACERALQAYTALGCRDFGRIDVRLDTKGSSAVPHIIEINPRPGLRPDWSFFTNLARKHGCPYEDLIEQIVESAAERVPTNRAKKDNGFAQDGNDFDHCIVGALVTGYWADHDGSKRMAFLGGLMILAVSMLAFLIGHSMIIFVVARLVQGASTASVNSIGTAIYADAFTDQGLGLAMGVLDLSMTLGLVSGPVIGGLMYHYHGYRAVLTSAFVLIALDLALRLLVLERDREAYLDPRSHDEEEPGFRDRQDITYLPSANVDETSSLGSSQASYGTITKDSDSVLDVTSSPCRSASGTADTAPKRLSDTQPYPRRSPTIELLLTPRLQVCLLGDFMVNVITTGLESVLPLQLKILLGYNSEEVALVLLMLVIPSFGGPLVGYIAGRYGPRPMISVGFAGLSPLLMLLRVTGQADFEQVKLLRFLLVMIGVCLNAVLTPVFVEFVRTLTGRVERVRWLDMCDCWGWVDVFVLRYHQLWDAKKEGEFEDKVSLVKVWKKV
ncbi:MAG: hypothetical protein Q9204_000390 [Flavoplaca sp. TL-2023a]